MSDTWIAEHVPAYLVFPDEHRPRTDEDAAMSAPVNLGEGDRRTAAMLLSDYLHQVANARHVQMSGESTMYRRAADMFEASALTRGDANPTLRIWGRVYRLRKKEN